MAFRGWSDAALAFFEGLEDDNSKAYWQAHKHDYDGEVRAPMEALVAELEPDWGPAKLFRPYRDVRFSSDKSPYKTTIATIFERGYYVQMSAAGLLAAAGMYTMAPDQLERFRAAVDDERSGGELTEIESSLAAQGITFSAHDLLKSAPRGYAKDHPRIALLRHKGLATWQEWSRPPWLGSAEPKARVTAMWTASAPLLTWLATHVGESRLPPERRR